MSSCVSVVVISLACDKHLSPRQLIHSHNLHYITWGLVWNPQIRASIDKVPTISLIRVFVEDPQNKGLQSLNIVKRGKFAQSSQIKGICE